MWPMHRSFVHFEALEDGGGGAPAEPAPEASPEPVVETGGATDLTADPAIRELIASEADQIVQARLAQILGQQQPPADPEQQAEYNLDPWKDGFGDQLAAFLASRDEQILSRLEGLVGPLVQSQQAAEMEKGNKLVSDLLADTVSRTGGDFLDPESLRIAEARGRELAQQMFERYGPTNRAAELAFERAVTEVRELEKKIGEAYHARKQNELQQLAGATREPGVAAQGAVRPPAGGDEESVALRIIARQGA